MIINDFKTQITNGLNGINTKEYITDKDFFKMYNDKKYSLKKYLFYTSFIISFSIVNLIINYSNVSNLQAEISAIEIVKNSAYVQITDDSKIIKDNETTINNKLKNFNSLSYLIFSLVGIDIAILIAMFLCKKYFKKYSLYMFFLISFFCSFNNYIQFQILMSNIKDKISDFNARYTFPHLNCSLIFFYYIFIDCNWVVNSMSLLLGSMLVFFFSIGSEKIDGIEGLILFISSSIFGYFSYLLWKRERFHFYILQNTNNYISNMENLINSFNSSTITIKSDFSVLLDKKSKKLISDIYFESQEKTLLQLAKIFLFCDIIELGDSFSKKTFYIDKILKNPLFQDLKTKLMIFENDRNYEEKENFLDQCEKEAKMLLEELFKTLDSNAFEFFCLIKLKISKFSKDMFLRVFIRKNKNNNQILNFTNSNQAPYFFSVNSSNANKDHLYLTSNINVNKVNSNNSSNSSNSTKNLSLEFLINDITSIVTLDEANTYNKERGIFLLKLSYEIRNPLTNILDLLHNIKQYLKNSSSTSNNELLLLINNIKHVKNFCKFMSSVIDDFEFFSNPKNNKDCNEKLEIEKYINEENINQNCLENNNNNNNKNSNEFNSLIPNVSFKNDNKNKVEIYDRQKLEEVGHNNELDKSNYNNLNSFNNLNENLNQNENVFAKHKNNKLSSNYNINIYNINNVITEKFTPNQNLENDGNNKKNNVNQLSSDNNKDIIKTNDIETNEHTKNLKISNKFSEENIYTHNIKATVISNRSRNNKANILNNNQNKNVISNQQKFINKFPNFSNFNLRKLITSVIKIFDTKIVLSNKNITLSMLINPNVPENIVSDYSKIKQILFNILSNSFKFTNSGLISVIVLKKNDFLEFTITDTGTGIQTEYVPYVFDAYFKCEDNPNNAYGAGIGLYIVKNFLNILGGEINIDSEINNGTTMFFRLPFYIQQDPNEYFIKLSLEPSESQIFLEQSTIIKKQNLNLNHDNPHDNLSEKNEESKSCIPFQSKNHKYYSTANILRDGFLKSPKLTPSSTRLQFQHRKSLNIPRVNTKKYDLESTRRFEGDAYENHNAENLIFRSIDLNVLDRGNRNILLDNNNIKDKKEGEKKASKKTSEIIVNNYDINVDRISEKDCESKSKSKHEVKTSAKKVNININNFRPNKDSFIYKNKNNEGLSYLHNNANEKINNSKENTLIFDDSHAQINANKNDPNEKAPYNIYINDSPSIFHSSNLFDKANKLSPITCKRNIRNLAIPMAISKYTTNLNKNKNRDCFKKFRIIIVDDELLIRQSTRRMFKKFFFNTFENVEIVESEDGFDCLYKIYLGLKGGIKYDLIITDETMSFMTGTIMASIIRSLTIDKILYRIPIYLMTNYSTQLYDENSEKIFNGVYSKPINLEILGSIIQSMCK